MTAQPPPPIDEPADSARPSMLTEMRTHEDWWAIWCGGMLLVLAFLAVWVNRPDVAPSTETAAESGVEQPAELPAEQPAVEIRSPLKPYLSKPGKWTDNPLDAFYQSATEETAAVDKLTGTLGAMVVIGVLFTLAMQFRTGTGSAFLLAFPCVFLLATLAYTMAGQRVVSDYNLEYALWALLVGLIISNTVGTPPWLKPAAVTEFYIKTGLVMLGAEVLLSRLLALGLPGIFVAWIVTPIVLITTYWFGQKVLKMPSRSLNMVISADMSVCGVSAAIATAAACKAKKEELSLAIGMSLSFTVVMMVVLPLLIKAIGMDEYVGGAWLGGTIDSTGAVAAAGSVLGKTAEQVAMTVKMIQNILIGVTAFGVALYWTLRVERNPAGDRPGLSEIWYRFPKFVLGFLFASIFFSLLHGTLESGPELVNATIKGSTKTLRGWLFCLAFVSIGLETNFRELLPSLRGGKPLWLYLFGQSLNLCLTLLMAWLMFGIVFRELIETIVQDTLLP